MLFWLKKKHRKSQKEESQQGKHNKSAPPLPLSQVKVWIPPKLIPQW